MLESGGKSEAV